MTYAEAVQHLYDLQLFGARFGLDVPERLAALAGRPQDRLRFIHVAGTNGKGSVCAMLEAIFRSAGLKTGLYTSPHLVSFTERLQVNRTNIPQADVVRLVERLRPILATFPPDEHPTFFEVVTVMALMWFAEQQVDIVIWETGLGGRLDATNIVSPLVSAITSIGLDHEKWLGDTLAKIAAEKAGIIKPGVPVVTGVLDSEPLRVIEAVAAERNAPLTGVPNAALSLAGSASRSLIGAHQRNNAAVAEAAVRAIAATIPVNDAAIRFGLENTFWPGRLQQIRRGQQLLLLDGAHNPHGAIALQQALREGFSGRRPALVFGAMKDKDVRAILDLLAPLGRRIVATKIASERAFPANELAKLCRQANPAALVEEAQSVGEALALVEDAPFVLLTGSLYFVGEALEVLGVLRSEGADEKALNDWKPKG